MKKFAYIFVAFFIISCSTNTNTNVPYNTPQKETDIIKVNNGLVQGVVSDDSSAAGALSYSGRVSTSPSYITFNIS